MKLTLILLLKYMSHVANLEGTYFLGEKCLEDKYFTDDEKLILLRLLEADHNHEVCAILEDKGMSAEEKNVALFDWLSSNWKDQKME